MEGKIMKKLLLVLLVALMGISSYGVLQMEAAPTSYHTEKVVVNRGDSLWGIASRYTHPGEDVREVIDLSSPERGGGPAEWLVEGSAHRM
jgi:hypothetical protein